mgnify:CR=1 FL=1
MSVQMIILIIAIVAVVMFIIITFNKGVNLRNYVKEAFSTMDVYLKKRWDLVPNLVTVVKSYAEHEQSVFTEIAGLRAGNYENMSDEEKMNTNEKLTSGLSKIMAVVENYPVIKADTHFVTLMEQLTSVENDIANSRKYYNGCVRVYNNYTEIFPTNITASVFGFKPAKMFEANDSDRQNVKAEI